MVSILSNMLSKSMALDQWSMPHRGRLSDAQAMREVPTKMS